MHYRRNVPLMELQGWTLLQKSTWPGIYLLPIQPTRSNLHSHNLRIILKPRLQIQLQIYMLLEVILTPFHPYLIWILTNHIGTIQVPLEEIRLITIPTEVLSHRLLMTLPQSILMDITTVVKLYQWVIWLQVRFQWLVDDHPALSWVLIPCDLLPRSLKWRPRWQEDNPQGLASPTEEQVPARTWLSVQQQGGKVQHQAPHTAEGTDDFFSFEFGNDPMI